MRRIQTTILLGCALALASCMTDTGEPLTVAEPAGAPATPEAVPLKPAPVRPPDAPGVATDGTLPPKPVGAPITASGTGWTVTLNATKNSLWPTEFTSLTATANKNVGPTPYYIRIWDGEAGVFIASCGTGTTCTGSVTRNTVDFTSFMAVVEDSGGLLQASSLLYDVYWHGSGVKLTDPHTTAAIGGTSTLTASTDVDIGSSPFYVEIFDITTGTMLTSCGTGTSCAVTVSQSAATTHAYQAFFSSFSASYPPANILEDTGVHYVTWSNAGYTVSLTVPSSTSSTVTATATASVDVGATPYYIEIFDEESGARLAVCGAGTTCSGTFTPSTSGNHLVAFISAFSTALPPPSTQASSHIATTRRIIPPG